MSNTNTATIAGLAWRSKVDRLIIDPQDEMPPINDPDSPGAKALLADILQDVNSTSNADLLQEYLALLEPMRNIVANNASRVPQLDLLIEIQKEVNRRTCQVNGPEIVTNPVRSDYQGRALRCIDGKEEIVALNTDFTAGYNDIKISEDSNTMVAAGTGVKRRFVPEPLGDKFRECSESALRLTAPQPETLLGFQIYSRCQQKQGTCSADNISPEWFLRQSLLTDVTINKLEISDDGTSIVAYNVTDNIVYIVRNQSCSSNSWTVAQTIRLEDNDAQYAVCGAMHASANHGRIVVANKNLTTDERKIYVLSNGASCTDDNTPLDGSISRNQYSVVQTILSDQRFYYKEVTVSRDGQTLLVEFGNGNPVQLGEPSGSNIEDGFEGLRIYHWQAASNDDCKCEFVLRQEIDYVDLPTNYTGNDPQGNAQYASCTKGRTARIFFAGQNDNRIIRIVDRAFDRVGDQIRNPLRSPWRLYVAEAAVLQVFDREELSVDICAKPVESCRDGIVNLTATNLKRGVFAPFVAKPSVVLSGCSRENEPQNMLYTHRVNKHIFATWCSIEKVFVVYCESETDNEWIRVPSSKFPFDWLTSTAGNEGVSYRGYMSFTDDINCSRRSNVCLPIVQRYQGRFVFRTISTDLPNPGIPGYFNGDTNPVITLNNVNGSEYVSPTSHFIASQTNRPDQPFLAGFPRPTMPPAADPAAEFTRAGVVSELPGSPAIPSPIPFPMQFKVWQRWPVDQPGFPTCRTGYFPLSDVNPFLRLGCNTIAEFVLTPRYYMFDPTSAEPEPNPNSDPNWIISRSTAPAYITISSICFDVVCPGKDCRCDSSAYPYYYRTQLVQDCEPIA